MPTTTKPLLPVNHLSNALARGEVTDFRTALHTYLGALAVEASLGDADGFWANERVKAERALVIYEAEVAHAKTRTINALRAANLTDWADALDAGDYSPLAF